VGSQRPFEQTTFCVAAPEIVKCACAAVAEGEPCGRDCECYRSDHLREPPLPAFGASLAQERHPREKQFARRAAENAELPAQTKTCHPAKAGTQMLVARPNQNLSSPRTLAFARAGAGTQTRRG